MSKIYLIVGSAGVYDFFREWNVAAYKREDRAFEHLEFINEWVFENIKCGTAKAEKRFELWKKERYLKNPFDPEMDVDTNGVFYEIKEVRFLQNCPPV